MKRELEKLLNYKALSAKTGLTVRQLQDMKYKGQLPYLNLGGGKRIRFRESSVVDALRKLEVREI
jgi:predicted DNA-binding transcriptional regulator AlpA